MTAPGTISRARLKQPGADYALLRAEAIRRVQAMAGDIWTDYNFSDPGVTIIEQLCYALTEMPYRAGFPVADLLCSPIFDTINLRRQGLFPAPSILPCNPVTTNDFRRLVLDRVPGVANAWFLPCDTPGKDPVRGLYDIAVLRTPDYPERGGCALTHRVERCYTAHRALCEDVATIHVLEPVATLVTAMIEIADEADPSDTLANAFFQLGLSLAPEPRRMSLAEKIALDPATSDVFYGPLMLRGFIGDDQLHPLPTQFTADQLVEILAASDGVLTVDTLSVHTADHPQPYREGTPIPVPKGHYLDLRTEANDGRFSIQMFRNAARCEPDPGRVRRRLAQLWNQQRTTYPLRAGYAERYGTPEAQYWDLKSYTSVQDQFPQIYGIGTAAMPTASAVPKRMAQIKQLKGYLLPFDQLLADSYAQLAFLRDLFSVEAGGTTTYRWQSLRGIVPDLVRMELLEPGYLPAMAELSAETDPVLARQNAVLDLLLSFYALALSPPAGTQADPLAAVLQRQQSIAAKQMLLRRAAPATRDRGRGVDYLRPMSSRSIAGAELLASIELGLLDAETADLSDTGESHARESAPCLHRKPFYLVDWILLRHARPPQQAEGSRYSFRVTAVLAASDEENDAAGWASTARSILRSNMPAHVAVECLFLRPAEMMRFEALYTAWSRALRRGPQSTLVETSRQLELFLHRHRPTPDPTGNRVARPSPPSPPSPSPSPSPSAVPDPQPPSPPERGVDTASNEPAGNASSRRLLARLGDLLARVRAGQSEPQPSTSDPAVVPASPGAQGFDTDTALTADTAAAFFDAGFVFAVRYLSLTTPEAEGDLNASEVSTIRAAGLALMAVQHVDAAGWVPTASLGVEHGSAAAANAASATLPVGVTIWLDLEGVADGTPSDQVIAYCNAWFGVVAQAGYRPGLYVGAECGLTSTELTTQLTCSFFWESGSNVPPVDGIGYCMVQQIDSAYVLDGVAYDADTVQADDQGATPYWYAAA